MNDAFSYATVGFPALDLESAISAIARSGFTRTEIASEHLDRLMPLRTSKLATLWRTLRHCGVRAQTVHAPCGDTVLGAPEETWRGKALQTIARYIHYAAELEADGLVVHAVPNPIFVPDKDDLHVPRRIGDAVLRSLDELLPLAEKTGVCLLLENLPYQCNYPLLSLRELSAAIHPYPARSVGLVVDTGHAALLGDSVADEILVAGDRLVATHLHDTDGAEDRHWLPTHGVIDWPAVHHALKCIDYTGAWTFEVINARNNETHEELCRMARKLARRWQDRMETWAAEPRFPRIAVESPKRTACDLDRTKPRRPT